MNNLFSKWFFIIVIAIACAAIVIAAVFLFSGKNHEEANEIVESEVKKLISSEAFRNGTLEERKRLSEELLGRLKKQHCIRRYSYDEKNKLFSYNCLDGSLGGIKLEEFEPGFN